MWHEHLELRNDLQNQLNLSNSISKSLMLFGGAKAMFHRALLIDSINFQLSKIGNKVTKNYSGIILAKSSFGKTY